MTKHPPQTISETPYLETEEAVAKGMFEAGYDDLLRIARTRRKRAGMGDTMQTEDILHECFLKLTGKTIWQSQDHFMRTASLAMRQVIIDHARKRLTGKRGSGAATVPLEDVEWKLTEFEESPQEIIQIADLLERLSEQNPRWLRIVDARYFSGMTEAETGAVLQLSERTVRREWRAARDWIAENMTENET